MTHKPKKSLGQNFLKSISALNKIVEAGEISKDDTILEIGPGKGILTEKLLEKASCVIAVEKDHKLFLFLQEKFSNQIKLGILILVHGDILKINITEILQNIKYKIIANIPYNITGAILKKFLTGVNQPEMMVLMLQNEVAKRICGANPASLKPRRAKESILSISVKAYGEPKIIMKVPARYFSPAPKVDSAVILIKNISRNIFVENKIDLVRDREGSQRASISNGVDEKQFWKLIHAGFAHKRKKLSSNLKIYLGKTSVDSVELLGNKRAEELTLANWINLAKTIDINKKRVAKIHYRVL